MSKHDKDSKDQALHFDNMYRLLNEHSALIQQNQQSITKLSSELIEVLKTINENLTKINIHLSQSPK